MKGYYAFWKYEDFPYALGGEITKMREDGAVQTVQYGPGAWFFPFKILPAKSGQEMMERMKNLSKSHDAAKLIFESEWRAQAEQVLSIPKEKKA